MTMIPRTYTREVHAEIDRLYDLHSDDRRHIDLTGVEVDLTTFLGAHPELMNLRSVAHALVDQHDRARRPKVSKDGASVQESLFRDDAIIPVGERERVRMGDAGREEVLAWLQIEVEEHSQHTASHLTKITFINESLRRLGVGQMTLRDVWSDLGGI
jgi:hypothetical protein